MKYTDSRKVKELAANILKDDKKMIELTGELEQSLKALKNTFLDDGIDEVNAFVTGLAKKLTAAQESFMITAQELKAYADLLEKGK